PRDPGDDALVFRRMEVNPIKCLRLLPGRVGLLRGRRKRDGKGNRSKNDHVPEKRAKHDLRYIRAVPARRDAGFPLNRNLLRSLSRFRRRLAGKPAAEERDHDPTGAFMGRRTVNMVRPGSDSTSMVPPNFCVTMR